MQIGTRWNFSFLRFRLLSEIFELSISKFSLLILIPLNFNWNTQFECRWLFLILRNSCRLNRSTMLLEVLSRINSRAFLNNFSKKDVYRINFIIKGKNDFESSIYPRNFKAHFWADDILNYVLIDVLPEVICIFVRPQFSKSKQGLNIRCTFSDTEIFDNTCIIVKTTTKILYRWNRRQLLNKNFLLS